jgi:site-specific DNA-adenine methylase
MANYGLPYQGSKDKLVHKISSVFKSAENFYDLFGGGFSMSHYMLLHHSKKYKHFYFNEIQKDLVELIKDAIAGKYNYNVFKPKWITREEFMRNKDTCAYTRIIWSFGNNMKSFMFGKEIENDKRSLHNAVVFGEFDSNAIKILGIGKWPEHLSIRGRRLMCRNIVVQKKNRVVELQQLERLQRLERLQQLERLQRLQRLEQLERLTLTSLSYDKVDIKPDSLIYCDPPYRGTAEYLNSFDHDKFWSWVRNQKEPVFVSEYTAPSDMKVLMAIRHKKSNSANTRTDSVEKLYGNEAAVRMVKNT